MKDTSLTFIVLTFNEEKHLARCLESVKNIASQIVVVDSGSTDKTLDIASKFGAEIVIHPFRNQADQFNWALENIEIKGDWILRLDADEYLTQVLQKEVQETLPKVPWEVSGFYMKRRVYFLGRWIRYGGYYPTWILRLFRKGRGKYEKREMDEHIILTEGETRQMKHDFVDENLHDLSWWTEKHNKFSSRETKARMDFSGDTGVESDPLGSQTERKRWWKENVYISLPLFLRVFLYFIYRYIFRFGFLDGKEGLIFHVLQGFWHQFLIDAKLFEIKKRQKYDKE